jgi:hypothetical protein
MGWGVSNVQPTIWTLLIVLGGLALVVYLLRGTLKVKL